MAKLSIGIFGAAPLAFHGGGEVSVRQLAEHWAARGHSVTFYSNSTADQPRRAVDPELGAKLSFGTQEIPFLEGTFLPGGLALDQPLPPPEALRAVSVGLLLLYRVPPPWYLAALARLGTPTVLLFHGVSLEPAPNPDARIMLFRWHQRYRLWRGARALRAPNLFVQVLNSRTQRHLLRLGMDPDRVFLIPTGVDAAQFRVGLARGRFQILFLGRLEKLQKGTRRLLRFLQLAKLGPLSAASVVIAGSGQELEFLRRETRDLAGVSVVGFVTDEAKSQLLADSDVFLVTSNLEPYCLTMVEGLASGLPAVSTPVAGPEYLVTQDPIFGELGTFDPATLVDLVTRYNQVWSRDPAAYRAERMLRRERALALFDRERMFERFDSMLEGIVGGSPGN